MGFPHSHPHMGHPALSGMHPHHPAYPYGPPLPGIPGMPHPSHPAILPPGTYLSFWFIERSLIHLSFGIIKALQHPCFINYLGLAAAAALAAGKYGACLPSGLPPGAAALAAAAAGNPYFTSVIKSGLAAATGPQGNLNQ